jgi:hypothetical protein
MNVIEVSKKFSQNKFVFKTTISRTNLTPNFKPICYTGIVKSLKKECNTILKKKIAITGHTFKKTSINVAINDRNLPLVNIEIVAFQAGCKLRKDETLKTR